MNAGYVSPAPASTSGVFVKFVGCQKILKEAAEGTYSCVNRGSISGQCSACLTAGFGAALVLLALRNALWSGSIRERKGVPSGEQFSN